MNKKSLFKALAILSLSLMIAACGDKKTYVITDHSMPDENNTQNVQAQLLQQLTQDAVYFDVNKEIIKPEFYNLLLEKAAILRKNPHIHVMIVGNADKTGTNKHNYYIAELRAKEVYNYLIMLGVNPSQLNTVSYGDTNPALKEDSKIANAMNRRVDFEIIPL